MALLCRSVMEDHVALGAISTWPGSQDASCMKICGICGVESRETSKRAVLYASGVCVTSYLFDPAVVGVASQRP